MNDLEGISFFQLGRGMRFPGNDITIELNHDATGADLQFFKQPSHIEPVRDLPLFSVDTNLHVNKKPSPQTTPWWLGKTVSSSSRLTLPNARGTVTLSRVLTPALSGSGSKGYLVIHQALSPPQADTPSI